MSLKYRKEIDGLRAIAVIPVVFFHAGFEVFSGGFVGVDVFFVISGYLITSLILKEIRNNKFSIIKFYERRARRILPALFLVIFCTIPLAFIFLTRSELGNFLKSIVATSLFYSNIFFWKETPYFRSEAELKPLLHAWSLSIEEQFYIIFPIFLIFLWRYKKEWIIHFLILCLVASLFLAEWASIKTSNVGNFYFTLSRVWELAIGAIVAYYLINRNTEIISKNLSEFLVLVGFVAIIYSVFFYSRETRFPSFYALVPTLGTALIIVFANPKTFVSKFLSSKIFVGVGLISYSFYLWNQPLLAFAKAYYGNISSFDKILIILISLVLSFFSWKFVEKFFRDRQKISAKHIFYLGFLFTIFFVTFGLATNNYFDAKSKGGSESRLAKLLLKNNAVYSTSMDERMFIKYRILYENLNPKTIVVGSSRIMQIPNDIHKNEILNLGVSGATMEDHITITEMALEKFNPKTILLGADPWLFNLYHNQRRWKSLSREYETSMLKINSLDSINIQILNNNLIEDSSIFEKILDKIYDLVNKRQFIQIPVEIENNNKRILLRNGREVFAKSEKNNNIEGKVINYSMETYKFSEDYLKAYDKFIKHLISHHKKEVVLVLTPYHIKSYEMTIKEKPFYLDIEQKFKDIGLQNSIKVIGSYNPKNNGCEKIEFYEDDHPSASCMAKVVKQLN